MAKFRSSRSSKKMKMLGMLKLKLMLDKFVQKGGRMLSSSAYHDEDPYEEVVTDYHVPEDVKKGHFAVVAVDEEAARRFIVPLTFLAHPGFLELLDLAAAEYGFDHKGALMVPCSPAQLEMILA